MLPDIPDYERLRATFRWRLPQTYNIGTDVADRWAAADPTRTAIIHARADGSVTRLSFGALKAQSDRLASALVKRGIGRGDRVAILLPQSPETAVVHCAVYKLGGIVVPLALLFGADALSYRLRDSGAKALVTNALGLSRVAEIQEPLPSLAMTLCVDGASGGALDFAAVMAQGDEGFQAVPSPPDDPALMIYTSGTTGPAKGALHGHKVLLGHLPGVRYSHGFFPRGGDVAWTPSDWAWAGGLLNLMLPALHFGVPVVAGAFQKFEPEAALGLMERFGVTATFVPPTALRMLRAVPNPAEAFRLSLRSIGSAGESLGAETYHWARAAFRVPVNEFYGQTECNYVLGSAEELGVSRPGSIGKPIPGHEVAVIRPDGTEREDEEIGQIAIRRPNPSMFLGYWNKPEATAAKFVGDWMITGDQGIRDPDGYIRFLGRDDDVITSAGYRIGPGEIEDCLLRHPAVALAAAVGKPDPLRTEIVKAFVQLLPGHAPSAEMADDIQRFVRTRLSAHEYPREVAFVNELPLTTTGKVIRRLLREE